MSSFVITNLSNPCVYTTIYIVVNTLFSRSVQIYVYSIQRTPPGRCLLPRLSCGLCAFFAQICMISGSTSVFSQNNATNSTTQLRVTSDMQSVAILWYVYCCKIATLRVCCKVDACTDIHPLRNVGHVMCHTRTHRHITCITYAHHDHITCIIAQVIACVMCALSQPHYAQGKMLTFNLSCDLSDSSKQQSNVGQNQWS